MSRYVFIYPHPDDESYNGGLFIQHLISSGHLVTLITLTQGGNGENHTNHKDLKSQRVKELKNAAKLLKIDQLTVFNYKDGFLKSSLTSWRNTIKDILEKNFDYVVTYDPSGATGHPDHITISEFIYNHWLNTRSYKLLWYLPSFWQWNFYIKNKSQIKYNPSLVVSGSLKTKLIKLSAIYKHTSQFKKSLLNHLKHTFFVLTGNESYHLVTDQDKPKFVYNKPI